MFRPESYPMTTDALPSKTKRIGPYSRAFRNALGDRFDGRSREGRFLRKVQLGLLAQLGREPSFAEELLIRRVTRSMLQLELLDEKFSSGTWSDCDSRVQGGLSNGLRLALKELGLKPPAAKKPDLATYLAEKAAK
jgi:hypothetical protein